MKLFVAFCALAALGATAAEPSPPGPLSAQGQGQAQPQAPGQAAAAGPGLRQAVQNFLRLEPSAPPRQLSQAERAELRRQLNEYGHRPERRPVHPETR